MVGKVKAEVSLEDVSKLLVERLTEGGVDLGDLLHAAEGLLGGTRPATAKAPARKKEPAKRKAAAKAEDTTFKTVPLDWSEVYYTNCPLISASNVDQELGWTREEFKKIGVKYAFMRSREENNWYPHYIHNMDNLIRFGGLFPPIAVHATFVVPSCSVSRMHRPRVDACWSVHVTISIGSRN